MPSPPSSHGFLFPSLDDCSSQVLDPHGQRAVTEEDEDEDEQSLHRDMQSVESRAKSRAIETVNYVSLRQVESGNSGCYGQSHQSAGRDEVIDPALCQQSNRSDAHLPSELSPKSNRCTLRSARRARPHSPKQQKSRANFSKEQRQILSSWLKQHMFYPYPKTHEVAELAAQTNLTVLQVRDWYTRYRKRNLQRIDHKQSHHSSDASATPIVTEVGEPLENIMEVQSRSSSLRETFLLDRSISPLDAYLQTSSRDEPISRSTADSLQSDDNFSCFSTRDGRTLRRQGTVCTTRTGGERTHQLSSQQSGHSATSNDTAGRPVGKKGQRIIQPPRFASEWQKDKRFQCTWCYRCHRYECDWIRDEETHNPQEQWICMHQGPRLVCNGDTTCAFCGISNPTDEHLDTKHNAFLCSQKPVEQRTFKRPDNLHRHMIASHHALVGAPPRSWGVSKHESDTQQFWCGFCSSFLRMTWKSWTNHLAKHYTVDKYDMTRWNPETSFSIEYPMSSPAANPDFDVAENPNLDGAVDPNVYGITNLNSDSAARLLDDAPIPDFDVAENPNLDGAVDPNVYGTTNLNFDSAASPLDDAAPPNSDDITPYNINDALNPIFDSNGNPIFDSFAFQWQ